MLSNVVCLLKLCVSSGFCCALVVKGGHSVTVIILLVLGSSIQIGLNVLQYTTALQVLGFHCKQFLTQIFLLCLIQLAWFFLIL